MNTTHNQNLTPYSQKLRKNMTKEERHLWYDFLKNLNLTVHRQKTVGCYIVDFCIPSKKIIIEVDGDQHNRDIDIQQSDKNRDRFLNEMGYRVIRYFNHDIDHHFNEICDDILACIDGKK